MDSSRACDMGADFRDVGGPCLDRRCPGIGVRAFWSVRPNAPAGFLGRGRVFWVVVVGFTNSSRFRMATSTRHRSLHRKLFQILLRALAGAGSSPCHVLAAVAPMVAGAFAGAVDRCCVSFIHGHRTVRCRHARWNILAKLAALAQPRPNTICLGPRPRRGFAL